MVTLLTLGVSFLAGVFFAQGGYWNTLTGAVLSVWASILDGCDGEVARLKLQSTKFGCWLETACDYLYYLFIFVGMSLGLSKTRGTDAYLIWGCFLLFGAVTSFLAVSSARKRFASSHPEKFLDLWQKKADKQKANPLMYMARNTEFVIRRCFLPYALLMFAIVNQILPLLEALSAPMSSGSLLYIRVTCFLGCRQPYRLPLQRTPGAMRRRRL